MRTPSFLFGLLLLLPTASVRADDWRTVAFRLPDADGKVRSLDDFAARYRLLVYQGIP